MTSLNLDPFYHQHITSNKGEHSDHAIPDSSWSCNSRIISNGFVMWFNANYIHGLPWQPVKVKVTPDGTEFYDNKNGDIRVMEKKVSDQIRQENHAMW